MSHTLHDMTKKELKAEVATLERDLATARKELEEARATSKVLNRRAQEAEGIIAKAGLVENRPQGKHGRSLGRALANFAASKFKEERDSLHAALTTANAEADRLREALAGSTDMLLMVAELLRDGPHYAKAQFLDEQVAANRAALAARKGTT